VEGKGFLESNESNDDVLEGQRLRIEDAEGDGAEPAHFAGVGPEGFADPVDVAPVVVAAEDGIVGAGLGQAAGDIRVVVQGDLAAVDFESGRGLPQSKEGFEILCAVD